LRPQIGEWSASHVLRVAEQHHVSAVIIDGAALATDLAPRLVDRDVKTVLIDDRGSCAFSVAAIVNHNIHAETLANTYPGAKRRLLGRKYLMLRRDIRRYTRGSCRPMTSNRLRVIVSFGGSDPVDATARTLELIPDDRPLELVVIAGPGFQNEESLRIAIAHAKDKGHDVDVRRAPDDPGALFVSADAAICSAGGTLGELAYLGCPAIAYAIAQDQVTPARHQVRAGLISGGRKWIESDDATVRSDLTSFLLDDARRLAQRQRALATADSDGPRRVIDDAIFG
jgi:spore coat polysaccharide biosynthesis predicted glycosyltransferase SpsG